MLQYDFSKTEPESIWNLWTVKNCIIFCITYSGRKGELRDCSLAVQMERAHGENGFIVPELSREWSQHGPKKFFLCHLMQSADLWYHNTIK